MQVEKIELVKSYVRDTTLFMQELWAHGLTKEITEKFGWVNPHLPFVAHYVNDGVVEIWEHKKAVDWYLDQVLTENQEGTAFLDDLLASYKSLLAELKKITDRGLLSTTEDIAAYKSLIYKAALHMTTFFYVGADERSPKAAQEIAVEARKLTDFFQENDVFVKKSLAKLGSISEEQAGVVLAEEVDNIPKGELLDQRLKAYLLVDGKEQFLGPLTDFVGANPEYVFVGQQHLGEITEIKGNTAYKGVVRGIVKIVQKQSHIVKVEKGDILVSPMTTPDFLSAMKLAGAFVTDEGGITCHAAIVAREMQTPCVIGTKVATQVLKDGDIVEVDADNGVVRIIS